jgi:hypothetical protein
LFRFKPQQLAPPTARPGCPPLQRALQKASQASEKHEHFQWSGDALTVPRRPHQGLGCPFTLYDRERWSGDRRTERPLWFIVELRQQRSSAVNNIIYIIGLVVVVIAVLSFFGLR